MRQEFVQGRQRQASEHWWTASGIAALSLFAGCVAYPPRPLAAEPRSSRDKTALQVEAEAIDHPLLPAAPFDLGDGLSPDEAAILAVLANPSLRAARDGAALADAQLLAARLLPNPELSASLETPTGGDTAGTVNAFHLEMDWDVLSLLRRPAQERVAGARRDQVRLDIAWQEWQTAMTAKAGAWSLASLNEQVSLAGERAGRLADVLGRVRQAVDRGDRTGRDIADIAARCRQAKEALLNLQAQRDQQRLQLARVLGVPPDTDLVLEDALELPDRFEPPPAPDMLAGLEGRRLDLLALRHGYASQEAVIRVAVLERFPRIDIGPTIGRETDNVETAGIGARIELPVFDRHQGRIAVEHATREALRDEYDRRVLEARSDVDLMFSRIQFLNRRIAAEGDGAGEIQARVNHLADAVDGGRADALLLSAARDELDDARMKELSLQGALAQAIVTLELTTGIFDLSRPSVPADQPVGTPKPSGST